MADATAQVNDFASLDRWFEGRSEQDTRVVAMRGSLRGAALFRRARASTDFIGKTLLPAFRAYSIIRFYGMSPQGLSGGEDITKSVTDDLDLAMASLGGGERKFGADRHGCSDLLAGIYNNVTLTPDEVESGPAAHSVDYVKEALSQFGLSADSIFASAGADVQSLNDGASSIEIAAKPLWPVGCQPDWFDEEWEQFSQTLREFDEGWEVWIQWYQDIIDGRPMDKETQLKIVMIPQKVWEQGASVVNAEVRGILEKSATKALPMARDVSIDDQGDIASTPPVIRDSVPGDISQQDLVLGVCARLRTAFTTVREPVLWNRFAVLAGRIERVEKELDRAPLAPDLLHDAVEVLLKALLFYASPEGEELVPDDLDSREFNQSLSAAMADLRHNYPALNDQIAARDGLPPTPVTERSLEPIRAMLDAVEDILSKDFEAELEEDVEAAEEELEQLPQEAKHLTPDLRNRVHRLGAYLLRIKRLTFKGIETVVTKLDKGVEAIKKAEKYRDAFEKIKPIWEPVWKLIRSLLDGGGPPG